MPVVGLVASGRTLSACARAWQHMGAGWQSKNLWLVTLVILFAAAQGVIHTQVTASVTKPEAVCSTVTNTFHFVRHAF